MFWIITWGAVSANCKVLQVMNFSGQEISPFVKKAYGEKPDYHNFYFAEIVEEY